MLGLPGPAVSILYILNSNKYVNVSLFILMINALLYMVLKRF